MKNYRFLQTSCCSIGTEEMRNYQPNKICSDCQNYSISYEKNFHWSHFVREYLLLSSDFHYVEEHHLSNISDGVFTSNNWFQVCSTIHYFFTRQNHWSKHKKEIFSRIIVSPISVRLVSCRDTPPPPSFEWLHWIDLVLTSTDSWFGNR